MQDYATRHGTAVSSRVTTADVLNGHGEDHADTKSHQGTIHTEVPSAGSQQLNKSISAAGNNKNIN